MKVGVWMVAALAAMMWVGTGCENGGGGGGDDFVGTWQIHEAGGAPWFVHFGADGTFFFSSAADGSGAGTTSTYTVSGGQAVGEFTNPGVGDGRIEATITDGTLNMNFIEYWHTPYNVVVYTGFKL